MTATDTDSEDVGRIGRDITESSRIVSIVRTLGIWIRGSFLYRWLTKEPDPEVIVIDLRETYTVGPIIWVLDSVIARLAPWWRASGLWRFSGWAFQRTYHRPVRVLGFLAMAIGAVALVLMPASGNPSVRALVVVFGVLVGGTLATRSEHSWTDLQSTRGYELLRAVLEPPEPPDETESGESSAEENPVDATEEVSDVDSQTR